MFVLYVDGAQIMSSDTVKPLLERLDEEGRLGFTTVMIVEVMNASPELDEPCAEFPEGYFQSLGRR